MQIKLTNLDEIVGLPALSLAEFFNQCDDQVTANEVWTWFHLDGREADEAIFRLVNEGYLDPVENRLAAEFVKTNKAVAVELSAPAPTLEISDVHNVVLALLWATNEVNTSPATAYRVTAVTLTGATINGCWRRKALVEAVVKLEPFTYHSQIQAGFEKLAHEDAVAHAEPAGTGNNPHAMSIQFIKDRLLAAHERLSLRFVVT